ncbi:hypothetical protein FNV43_RR18513 [Rhamnella rubrinervis]|uniref:Uncharacterized protein n=1 Tax=Rhamnella rubrinervis TaxID=2594499 RepID=A0A8K0GY29_9ROSA|nr:hypothetical protein FNV43_RR18513 [Rhamnella rubrinervis]
MKGKEKQNVTMAFQNFKGSSYEVWCHSCEVLPFCEVLALPVRSEAILVRFEVVATRSLVIAMTFGVIQPSMRGPISFLQRSTPSLRSQDAFLRAGQPRLAQKADTVAPEFVSASLFPPKDTTGHDPSVGIVKENTVSKRFRGGVLWLMTKVSDEIRKMDCYEFVKKLQEEYQVHLEFMKEGGGRLMRDEVMTFSFTSLCRFPIHVADFGWGKPTWVGLPALAFQNLVVFMDTKNGDGIEVYIYISLNEEHMSKLEDDEEFLTFF